MYFIANDKGSDLREQSWAPDTEPVPAMIDTWSRGTCQGRPRVPPPLSRPASGAYTLSSSSSYGNSQRVSHIRPGSAGGDRSRRSPSRPGSASSAPGGLRATVSTPALSKGSSTGSAGSSGGMVESVVGPGGKIQVVARAPPKPAEAAMTVEEKLAAIPRESLGTLQLKKAAALRRQLEREEQLELEQMGILQLQCKGGKTFTYGSNAKDHRLPTQTIIVKPPKPEHLPALHTSASFSSPPASAPKLTISEPATPATGSRKKGKGASSSAGAGAEGLRTTAPKQSSSLRSLESFGTPSAGFQSSAGKKSARRASDGSGLGWEYEPSDSAQPAINESISMQPGVTLEVGNGAYVTLHAAAARTPQRVSGGEALQPAGRLSKLQYKVLHSSQMAIASSQQSLLADTLASRQQGALMSVKSPVAGSPRFSPRGLLARPMTK